MASRISFNFFIDVHITNRLLSDDGYIATYALDNFNNSWILIICIYESISGRVQASHVDRCSSLEMICYSFSSKHFLSTDGVARFFSSLYICLIRAFTFPDLVCRVSFNPLRL